MRKDYSGLETLLLLFVLVGMQRYLHMLNMYKVKVKELTLFIIAIALRGIYHSGLKLELVHYPCTSDSAGIMF